MLMKTLLSKPVSLQNSLLIALLGTCQLLSVVSNFLLRTLGVRNWFPLNFHTIVKNFLKFTVNDSRKTAHPGFTEKKTGFYRFYRRKTTLLMKGMVFTYLSWEALGTFYAGVGGVQRSVDSGYFCFGIQQIKHDVFIRLCDPPPDWDVI